MTADQALAFIGDGTSGSRDPVLEPGAGTDYDQGVLRESIFVEPFSNAGDRLVDAQQRLAIQPIMFGDVGGITFQTITSIGTRVKLQRSA